LLSEHANEGVRGVAERAEHEGQEQARGDPDVRNLPALSVAEHHAADEQIEREVVQPSGEEHRANAERLRDVSERVEMPYEPGQHRGDEREVDRREAELDRVGMKERACHLPPRREDHERPGDADRDRDELQDEIEAHLRTIAGPAFHAFSSARMNAGYT